MKFSRERREYFARGVLKAQVNRLNEILDNPSWSEAEVDDYGLLAMWIHRDSGHFSVVKEMPYEPIGKYGEMWRETFGKLRKNLDMDEEKFELGKRGLEVLINLREFEYLWRGFYLTIVLHEKYLEAEGKNSSGQKIHANGGTLDYLAEDLEEKWEELQKENDFTGPMTLGIFDPAPDHKNGKIGEGR